MDLGEGERKEGIESCECERVCGRWWVMEKEEVEDDVFEWCPSCSKYTYHVRTAENIIRCKECGHGQWY